MTKQNKKNNRKDLLDFAAISTVQTREPIYQSLEDATIKYLSLPKDSRTLVQRTSVIKTNNRFGLTYDKLEGLKTEGYVSFMGLRKDVKIKRHSSRRDLEIYLVACENADKPCSVALEIKGFNLLDIDQIISQKPNTKITDLHFEHTEDKR